MADFLEFFTLLDILPAFDIDLELLEASYFCEQQKNHPDRFVKASKEVRLAALTRAADINRAYETLKDPLKRAQYLLLLQGIYVGTDKDTVKPSQALLEEVMELRERIVDIDTPQALFAMDDELQDLQDRIIRYIDSAYANTDWDKMAQMTLRLGYIHKTKEDLKKQKARLGKKK